MGQIGRLISCFDCGNPVSPNAMACPSCGSKQLAGPPVTGLDKRMHNVEARNDRNMIVIAAALGALGASLGVHAGSGPLTATLLGLAYGVIGIIIGVPLAAFVNITRRLWY